MARSMQIEKISPLVETTPSSPISSSEHKSTSRRPRFRAVSKRRARRPNWLSLHRLIKLVHKFSRNASITESAQNFARPVTAAQLSFDGPSEDSEFRHQNVNLDNPNFKRARRTRSLYGRTLQAKTPRVSTHNLSRNNVLQPRNFCVENQGISSTRHTRSSYGKLLESSAPAPSAYYSSHCSEVQSQSVYLENQEINSPRCTCSFHGSVLHSTVPLSPTSNSRNSTTSLRAFSLASLTGSTSPGNQNSSIYSPTSNRGSLPQLPSFLGRYRTEDYEQANLRSFSFGSATELQSSALKSSWYRTSSLKSLAPSSRQPSLSSLHERPTPCRLRTRSVSISSVEDLRNVLSSNKDPLFIDIEKRHDLNLIFPSSSQPNVHHSPSTPSRRCASRHSSATLRRLDQGVVARSPKQTTQLIFSPRSASITGLRHQYRQPLFVPSRIIKPTFVMSDHSALAVGDSCFDERVPENGSERGHMVEASNDTTGANHGSAEEMGGGLGPRFVV